MLSMQSLRKGRLFHVGISMENNGDGAFEEGVLVSVIIWTRVAKGNVWLGVFYDNSKEGVCKASKPDMLLSE